jgi:hypothetical protein
MNGNELEDTIELKDIIELKDTENHQKVRILAYCPLKNQLYFFSIPFRFLTWNLKL